MADSLPLRARGGQFNHRTPERTRTMATEPKNTTKFGKGNPGKPKGAVNKNTAQLKDMILKALDGAGGVDYLMKRANDPRTASAFLTLVGKVLPMQVTGEGGDAINVVTRVELVPLSGVNRTS